MHLILDACVELAEEVGYDGLNTRVIAQRAGVSTGSLYQFFTDLRAILRAARRRNTQVYLDRLSDRFAAETPAHWWEGAEAALDEYIAVHRDVPGVRILRFGDVGEAELLAEERVDTGDQISRELAQRFGIDDAGFRRAVQIAVVAADALITLAFLRNPDGDEVLLAEAKVLFDLYLRRHGTPPGPAGRPDGAVHPSAPDRRGGRPRQQATPIPAGGHQ
ncbi:TetR/AcrR family transcriptional regulator [Solwaraspora sp. WMMD1047]|uniref:TetR/AcrR family transcriptional regulator n=1 Tax=Solwaraspora sp. WMMD1047 TaxID=3016102 RepID=UPI002417191B|nr:TetR/AcrR family transcriptional regulator [Solwaraspora sp. WMMD1047]MDG4829999.1 TetR/AcrR family transcriptional regulator [Solwaraspora sp. WMMD1047]